MRLLVATHRHSLLPFAWRLKREGYDVETLVWKDRYEKAWDGMFAKALKGKEKSRENLETLGDMARSGEFLVMVDSERGEKVFDGAPGLFGAMPRREGAASPLAVGGWFDGEEVIPHLTHLLVKDVGLLTGGLGLPMMGGATLVKLDVASSEVQLALQGLAASQADEMKSAGFKGLFSVDMAVNPDGAILAGTLVGGWQPVHTHAFVSDLSSLGNLLEGKAFEVTLESNYVTVVPVTVPPFPITCEVKSVEEQVGGLEHGDLGQIFFHDFKTKGDAQVYVGGLDGLLAVVRGSGHCHLQAQADAYRVANKITVTGKQMRLDVGNAVPSVLAALEASISQASSPP